MIETTYVRLEQAAKILDTDADTLLIAAAEGRIQAYWLLNGNAKCERGRFEEVDHDPGEPGDIWVPYEVAERYILCALLDRQSVASILKLERVILDIDALQLTVEDAEGFFWCVAWDADVLWDITVERKTVFFLRADITTIQTGSTKQPDTIPAPTPHDRAHVSDALVLLNQAARHWWANAVKRDPSTHPKNSGVAAWLTDRGMSASLAKHAAAIIRPEWAHSGRKPDA